jgi:hypothetical protein
VRGDYPQEVWGNKKLRRSWVNKLRNLDKVAQEVMGKQAKKLG